MKAVFDCECTGLSTMMFGPCMGCKANIAIAAAVVEERERCAKLAEDGAEADPHNHAYEFGMAIAARIREGEK